MAYEITNIPTTSSFDKMFGEPGRAYVDNQSLKDMVLLDRTVYGGRFSNITSHLRSDETDPTAIGNYNMAAYPIDTRWHSMYKGIIYTVPDVIPGSQFVVGTSTSEATLAARGGLSCMFRGANVDVFFGMRTLSIAGTYGQSTTFGSWNFASGTVTGATPEWQGVTDIDTEIDGYNIFPAGTSPGDTFELAMWARRANPASDGYIMGWMECEAPSLFVPGEEPIYSQLDGFIGAWSAKDLTGTEDDRVSTLPIFEEGTLTTDISQNTASNVLQLKLTSGPDGGPCVRMQGVQYNMPSAGRTSIVNASKGCVVAVIQCVSSISNGFANCGTSGDTEHWGLSDPPRQIYTEFLSDTRTGRIFNTNGVLNNWHVAVIRRDGGTIAAWVNDTKIHQSSVGSFSVAGTIQALGVTAGGILNVREVAWYADAPSDSEISDLIDRVQARHGL
jgi:hypothetical protein